MKKVLVIGDGCTDVFQYGICERLSPEAPVPVFKPTVQNKNKGMAINVHNNLLALNVHSKILSRDSSTKTRYVDEVSNQMLLRIDENNELEPLTSLSILTNDKWDGVVISDYNKGFLTEDIISEILTYCKKNQIQTFLDTKKKYGTWANNAKFIKINEKEYNENFSETGIFDNHLIVTLGNKGATHRHMLYTITSNYSIENKVEVLDLSGAGDTFLAGFVADYLENNDIASAIKFANRCASYVVTQKGVVVVDKYKI